MTSPLCSHCKAVVAVVMAVVMAVEERVMVVTAMVRWGYSGG